MGVFCSVKYRHFIVIKGKNTDLGFLYLVRFIVSNYLG